MKKFIFSFLVLGILLSCSQPKEKHETPKEQNTEINVEKSNTISQLTNFYTLYFSEIDKENINEQELDSLLKENLTLALYKKINELNLDYDPILNGQDISPNWKNTLNISYVPERDLYKVCTTDNPENCSFLKITKEDNKYKIEDIVTKDTESLLKLTPDSLE